MARLPQPGNDNGTWGDILNEFLAQVHKTDGTLKDGAVSSNTIADDAVTAKQIADATIQEAQLAPAVVTKLNAASYDGGIDSATAPAPFSATGTRPWKRQTTTRRNASATVEVPGELIVDDQGNVYGTNGTSQTKDLSPLLRQSDADGRYGPYDGVSVKRYGATGNGTTDDTAAVASAYTAANAAGLPLYFPPGTYLVTSLPDVADHTTIRGAGSSRSVISYAGTGTLRTWTNKYDVSVSELSLSATAAGATLLELSNSFRCTLTKVTFKGFNSDSSGATYHTQVGLKFTNNTGATNIISCDFENLGIGLQTATIQNYMIGGKFTECWRSVYGVGGSASAGMNFVAVEFIGSAVDGVTDTHIYIDGSADSWYITDSWFEKCQYAARIGVAGTGGPSQFMVMGGKVAAKLVGLQFNHCRQPQLTGVKFDVDDWGTMTELTINATYCPEGSAIDLITILRSDFSDGDFPQYWTVVRKGNLRAGNVQVNSNITVANAFSLPLWGPAVANNAGTAGRFAISGDYLYVCTATNTWKRVAISTW